MRHNLGIELYKESSRKENCRAISIINIDTKI